MAIYYGDANGKAQEVIVVGKPGPQGPAGPQGVPGPQGPAGQGVPAGGAAEQMLVKKIIPIITQLGQPYLMLMNPFICIKL